MESASNEALIIGINVFIFIIALTISINLMNSVMDMSEKANEIIKSEHGSMIPIESDTTRIIKGEELINYSTDIDMNNQYKLKYDGEEWDSYIARFSSLQSIIGKKYTITYQGIDVNNKEIYEFKSIP